MNFNTKRAYYDSFRKGKKFEYNCISKFCFVFLTNNGILRLILDFITLTFIRKFQSLKD